MLRTLFVPIAVLVGTISGIVIRPEFFDIPSLLLTLGGAVAVTCFSYSRSQLCDLVRAIQALFTTQSQCLEDHIDELSRLTHLYRLEGLRGLENQERHLTDPFLRQGVTMLVDLQRTEIIHARLDHERAKVLSQHEISRQMLLTLGKLLPSFGLIGTLTGMVLLLRNISGQNVQSLPAALSLAVLTTLYGAVLSNVIVGPLAARLHAVALETEAKMQLTIEWVMMLLRGESAVKIANKWNGLQAPHDAEPSRDLDWSSARLLPQR